MYYCCHLATICFVQVLSAVHVCHVILLLSGDHARCGSCRQCSYVCSVLTRPTQNMVIRQKQHYMTYMHFQQDLHKAWLPDSNNSSVSMSYYCCSPGTILRVCLVNSVPLSCSVVPVMLIIIYLFHLFTEIS